MPPLLAFTSPLPFRATASQFTSSRSTLSSPPKYVCAKSLSMAIQRDSTKSDEATHNHDTPHPSKCPHDAQNLNSDFFRVDPQLARTDSEENLRGFVKTRGSLIPGEEFVFWFVGDIYDMVDEQTSNHLFAFEGYNIGRMVRIDGGWRMLTREVGIYKDKKTGEILDIWENPHTGKTNKCLQVWNDPVNQQFLAESPRGKFKVPTTVMGDDIYWHAEVFLKYKSPLSKSEYPEIVGSDFYQSAEMFQFFSSKQELASDNPTADCTISWVRLCQWLPWMEMGDRSGRMVFHCRGRRLKNGYADLSHQVREYVERAHPEYASAPNNYTTPNETSWTYMRKLLESKGQPRADGRIAWPEPETVVLTKNGTNEHKDMTREQLKEYNGSDAAKPIYLSVSGRIFDVSSAKRHYQPGETYHSLTGRDASKAFVMGDLKASEITSEEAERLTEAQQEDLKYWEGFFESNYPEVGRLLDF